MLLEGQEDGEARDMFMEELYDDGKTEETALDQLRKHMEAQGIWEAGGG